MTSHFTAEHAETLLAVGENGAPVSFAHATDDGTYLADIDFETYVAPVPVTGQAMRVKGDPRQLTATTRQESESVTLLFAPDAIGTEPELDMIVTWGAHSYAVKAVDPVVSLDGVTILARVTVAR